VKKFIGLIKATYEKLFQINDTPQKIALGLGLGVFLGILPGTGPIAALVASTIFKANRASALLGSLLTNTWLSLVTFIAAIQTGSIVLGLAWQDVYRQGLSLAADFHFADLFKASMANIILPIALGYAIVSFILGLLVYLIAFAIISKVRSKK
jgi:hypothetical protein